MLVPDSNSSDGVCYTTNLYFLIRNTQQHTIMRNYATPRQAAMADKAALREELVVAEERQLELEAEVRGLKAAVVDAQTNAEQLEEMSR